MTDMYAKDCQRCHGTGCIHPNNFDPPEECDCKDRFQTPDEAKKQPSNEVGSISLLAKYHTNSARAKAEKDLDDGDATAEILAIATVLRELADSTEEHYVELSTDGFVLRAEEARCRCAGYWHIYNTIVERYG